MNAHPMKHHKVNPHALPSLSSFRANFPPFRLLADEAAGSVRFFAQNVRAAEVAR